MTKGTKLGPLRRRLFKGSTRYSLKVTTGITMNGDSEWVRFTVTNEGGTKQHANVTLDGASAEDLARMILDRNHLEARDA